MKRSAARTLDVRRNVMNPAHLALRNARGHVHIGALAACHAQPHVPGYLAINAVQ